MYEFAYHKPDSLDAVKKALADGEDPKLLAGGMTLLPTLKLRLAQPSDLIDLGALKDLRGICRDGDAVVIGAMTRHGEVAASSDVRELVPALAEMAEVIGDPAVRNRGTLGGSLANNDPAADYPAAVLALGATVRTSEGRDIAAGDFFKGLFETALEEQELIVSVRFPSVKKAAYMKFRNPASRYALVGVMVAQTDDGARVAVIGAGQDGVFRLTALEQALDQDFSPAAVDGVEVSEDGLNDDIHAAADYRAHLIKVMARRAIEAALAR